MADAEELSLDSVFEAAVESSDATTRAGAIVVAVHACLLADGFHLVAIGDEGFESNRFSKESVSLSSATKPGLPEQWKASSDVFAFQYKQTLNSERVCLVKALPIGDQIIVNVLCSNQPNEVLTVSLSLDQYTREVKEGERVSMSTYKTVLKLFTTINKEINSKIKKNDEGPKAKPACKVREVPEGTTREDPLRIGGTRRPYPHPQYIGQSPYGGYGAGDLSPFGGPGGMMMDPFRQGGMIGPPLVPNAPGFVPPGARYDPVSPFRPNLHPGPSGMGRGRGSIYGPDPDHLPPPGSDDMFS